MLQGEPWDGMRDLRAPKRYRQRVAARRRPMIQQTANVETQNSTTQGRREMLRWLANRFLPRFPTPEGGRL